MLTEQILVSPDLEDPIRETVAKTCDCDNGWTCAVAYSSVPQWQWIGNAGEKLDTLLAKKEKQLEMTFAEQRDSPKPKRKGTPRKGRDKSGYAERPVEMVLENFPDRRWAPKNISKLLFDAGIKKENGEPIPPSTIGDTKAYKNYRAEQRRVASAGR